MLLQIVHLMYITETMNWLTFSITDLLLKLLERIFLEWANSHSHDVKSTENPSKKNGGYYNSKAGLNLKWDVQQAHMSVMARWSYLSAKSKTID